MSEADEEPMEKPGEEWFGGKHKMTKKKGPFDAAIRIIEDNSGWVRDAGGKLQYPPEIETAIHILKAAGKVDKKECLEVFNLFVKNTTLDSYDDIRYRHDGLAVFPIYQIRALLESLPDKEGEKR
jgi:hypothetical protein